MQRPSSTYIVDPRVKLGKISDPFDEIFSFSTAFSSFDNFLNFVGVVLFL